MTNYELAKSLNISPSSLSIIVNNKPGVSDSTRQRVLQKLEEMGYANKVKAVSAQPETIINKNIGYVIYKKNGMFINEHPFFVLLLESIESRAKELGYNVLLITLDGNKSTEDQITALETVSTSGYIVFGTEMTDDDHCIFKKLSRPYIVIDNSFPCFAFNEVSINNNMGAFQAIEYLYNLGHRHIGYLKSKSTTNSFAERCHGFKSAFEKFNLKPEPLLRISYTETESYNEFKKYLQNSPTLPTAFVADDDTIAIGALRALQETNIKVPEDISLIGFNNRPNCALTEPPLTTISVRRQQFGSTTVDFLVNLISDDTYTNQDNTDMKIRIGTHLIKRDSVLDLRNEQQ